MTKLEGNLTPNVRFNAKGDNSLLVVRWGSDAVPGRPPTLVGGASEGPAPLLGVATLARVSTRLLCPLREPSPLLSGPAPLRLSPPREGELEAAEEHPRLRARDAAVHTLPEKQPLLH